MERRFVEIRADDAGRITGVVMPYNTPAKIGRFEEVFLPGAFKPLGDNIRANLQHERSRPLARNIENGGLELSDSEVDLRAALTLPDTMTGQEARELISRRVLTGFSVEFTAIKETWQGVQRTIREATLHGIGLVDSPAHESAKLDMEKRYKEVTGKPEIQIADWDVIRLI